MRIVPLRIRADLTHLSAVKKKNLQKYANIEKGISERILLVPDNITVGALNGVIDKSFGLFSELYDSAAVFKDADRTRIFPDLQSIVNSVGLILSDPTDTSLYDFYQDKQIYDPISLVKGPIYPIDKGKYKERQKKFRRIYKEGLTSGVDFSGSKMLFKDIPATDENIEEYLSFREIGSFVPEISLDMQLFELLSVKGRRVYNADDFVRNGLKVLDGKSISAKPLAHSYDSLRYGEAGDAAFRFHVDILKEVSFLISDGSIAVEDYINSVLYVSNTFYPDCIYKNGYDLFGEDAENYYDFIMGLHSGSHDEMIGFMNDLGWREPFLDVTKVLR